MDLDELRSVQRTEREKDSLQSLRDSFYEDVAAYLRDLTAQRDRAAEQAEDPFASEEVRQLTDRIETAEDVSEAVYERRVGKVVKLASFTAAEMSVDEAGMTTQEQELFDDLVARIRQNKSTVLDILAGDAAPTTATETPSADATVAGSDPAAASDASGVTSDSPPPTDRPDAAGAPDAAGRDAPSESGEPSADAGVDEREREDPPDGAGGVLTDAMGGETSGDGAAEQSESTRTRSDQSEDGHTPVDPAPAPPDARQADERDAGGATTASGATDSGSGRPDDSGDANAGSSRPDTERTTVRITRDVGQILGTDDREYDLSSEDVVTLPEANAEPLVQKDAAEKLE